LSNVGIVPCCGINLGLQRSHAGASPDSGAPRVNERAMIEQRAAPSGLCDCPLAGQAAEKLHKFVFRRLIWAGTLFA